MTNKPTKRPVNGVLLLDKPESLSSNTALQKARRLFRAEKAGHTGVLDPLATGLLPVCFGEATKFAQYLIDADKAYTATLKLGEASSTGDAEGEIIATARADISLSEFQTACQADGKRIRNIVEPRHPSRAEFYTAEATKLGLPAPDFIVDDESNGKIVNTVCADGLSL